MNSQASSPLYPPEFSNYPDHILLNLKPPPKISQTCPERKQKTSHQMIKEGSKKSRRISLSSMDPPKPLQASEIRRLTTHIKRLKHLAEIEIDISSLPLDDPKIMPAFFNSLKHFKKTPKIHFFTSQHSISLSDRMVSSLCQAIASLRALPNEGIILSISLSRSYFFDSFENLLRSFARHDCLSCLHLTIPKASAFSLSELLTVISIFKNSKSLHQLDLTLDEYNFDDQRDIQEFFESFKELKSVKNLKIYFNKCSFNYYSFRRVPALLKQINKVQNLQVLFEEKKAERLSKFEWSLFVRSLNDCTNFQKVQAKYLGKVKTISDWEFYSIFVTVILFIVIIVCIFL